MPLYEFTCTKCEKTCEFLLRMGETKRKCPDCGALKLERQISNIQYHDTYSPMHPRRGRGHGGAGRLDPGDGSEMGKHF